MSHQDAIEHGSPGPGATPAPTVAQLIFSDGTPRKAFLTALVVGSILTAINHGDLIVAGEWPPVLKIALTYCVPYCVTTWGAATGKLAQWRRTLQAGSA